MKPRVFTLFFAITVSYTAFVSYISAETYSADHEKVQRIFESDEEKMAQDAVWVANDVFKVHVFDDGSNRDAYASYVCKVLSDHGFKGEKISVLIVDYTKVLQTGVSKTLGQANCQ